MSLPKLDAQGLEYHSKWHGQQVRDVLPSDRPQEAWLWREADAQLRQLGGDEQGLVRGALELCNPAEENELHQGLAALLLKGPETASSQIRTWAASNRFPERYGIPALVTGAKSALKDTTLTLNRSKFFRVAGHLQAQCRLGRIPNILNDHPAALALLEGAAITCPEHLIAYRALGRLAGTTTNELNGIKSTLAGADASRAAKWFARYGSTPLNPLAEYALTAFSPSARDQVVETTASALAQLGFDRPIDQGLAAELVRLMQMHDEERAQGRIILHGVTLVKDGSAVREIDCVILDRPKEKYRIVRVENVKSNAMSNASMQNEQALESLADRSNLITIEIVNAKGKRLRVDITDLIIRPKRRKQPKTLTVGPFPRGQASLPLDHAQLATLPAAFERYRDTHR